MLSFFFLLLLFTSYLFAFPKEFVLRSDDWGYFDAVSKSIMSDRIMTSDWLAPSNFGFTSLSYFIYLFSENFYLATFGLLFFSFFLASYLLYLNFRHFKISIETACLLTVFIFSTPIIFYKGLDFTSVPTYLAVILGAVLAFLKKKTWVFYFLVILGLTIRQSAVALLALPLMEIYHQFKNKNWTELLKKSSPAILSVLAFFLLDRGITKGFASVTQVNLTEIIDKANWSATTMVISQLLLYGLPVVALMQWVAGLSSFQLLKKNLLFNISLVLIISLFISLSCRFTYINLVFGTEVPFLFDTLAKLLLLNLLSLFLVNFKAIPFNSFMHTALLYAFLLFSRGFVGDYYLLDFFFYLTFAILHSLPTEPKKLENKKLIVISSCLGAWILFIGYQSNYQIESKIIRFQMLEKAYRSGKLNSDLSSETTWGLLGWKLFPYFVKYGDESEKKSGCLICHLRYVHKFTSGFIETDAKEEPPSELTNGAVIISQTKMNYIFSSEFVTLFKAENNKFKQSLFFDPSPVVVINRDVYQERCAPLSNKEWGIFLKSQGTKCEE
jgi:hypothetical protein